jgi:DNA-directed RNA polymerase subunit RPC12/RpoP
MQKCEDCNEYKDSAFRRSETGRIQCDECYLETLSKLRPSQYVVVPKHLQVGAIK